MGLGGRKTKQRIGADPRNLSWADDAAKFGQAYLAKMGWNPAQGLGVAGDGRTAAVKVAQKLNLLGIGAGAQAQGPDGVAWRQNRDYEMLLERLNAGAQEDVGGSGGGEEKEGEGQGEEGDEAKEGEEVKKRKRSEHGREDRGEESEKKKRKKEKKEKKEKKGRAEKDETKEKSRKTSSEKSDGIESDVPAPVALPAVRAPRPMAHRARFLRSKQLASQSSTAVAEILGIPASASTPASGSASPRPPDSVGAGNASPAFTLDQELMTTAPTSVADYFKAKLAARARAKAGEDAPGPVSSAPSPLHVVAKTEEGDNETPRFGIGARGGLGRDPGGGETYTDEPVMGLGSGVKFGGLMGGGVNVAPLEEKRKSKKDKKDKNKKRKENAPEEGSEDVKEEEEEDSSVSAAKTESPAIEGDLDKTERKKKKKEHKEGKEKRRKKRRKEEDSS